MDADEGVSRGQVGPPHLGFRTLGLLLVATVFASAETTNLPEPYRSLVSLAHAAPPEFAADALLRLVESGKIADRDARDDLTEQAFRLAGAAKFPVRMRGLPGTTVDTRSGFLSQAYGLKLDALSLQSRAVLDMLKIDPAKARKLFLDIPPPALAPLTCDDALVYDVSDFYQALAAVANGAFTEKERSKEEHINFLLDFIGQLTSPVQFLPLAQAIQSASVPEDQREILWVKFNGMLQSIQSDARSFSALSMDPGQASSTGNLAIIKKSLPKVLSCKDDASQSQLDPNGATPKIEKYWQSPEAQKLLEDGKRLRITADGKLLTDADRSTPEWQQQLTDYLSELAAWGSGQEKSEADYYNEKSLVYIALVELIPPGPLRDKMLAAFVDFVSNSSLQQQSPVEWFLQANAMLERVRQTNNGEPDKVLAAFEQSGNPVLVLQVAMDKALGAKAPAWLTK